jgi:predicted ATPase
VLVGENGSGKSTIVEMLARVRTEPRGRFAQAELFQTRDTQPPGTGPALIVERGPGRPRWSYFLRADTTHSLYSYLEDHPNPRRPERFHQLSHGEGFLELLRTRVNQAGFYLMDEPDAPLSFTACLGLAALLHDLAREGSQAIVATHSPLIAAVPGAAILELGDWGIRSSRWEDLYIVSAWRRFPDRAGLPFPSPVRRLRSSSVRRLIPAELAGRRLEGVEQRHTAADHVCGVPGDQGPSTDLG